MEVPSAETTFICPDEKVPALTDMLKCQASYYPETDWNKKQYQMSSCC